MTDKDKELIRNYLLGGAALGGGAALTTALVNYLKNLKGDNIDEEDDDTLKIYKVPDAPIAKQASSFLRGPLALAGGALTAAGSYALVNKLYEQLRKQEAQEELDKAQELFLGAQGFKKLDEETEEQDKANKNKSKKQTEKKASRKGMRLGELAMSLPIAIPLLMALGSGVVAHKMLNKAFPIKQTKVTGPRRIEIIDAPASQDPNAEADPDMPVNKSTDEDDAIEKPAFYLTEDDATELMIRTVDMCKKADSNTRNILATAANGNLGLFKAACSQIGFINALDTIKGANANVERRDALTDAVAIGCITKSASVGEQTKLIAASEFAAFYPTFFKMAGALEDYEQEALYGVAQCLGHAIRSEIAEEAGIAPGKAMCKSASIVDALTLERLLTDSEEDTPDSGSDAHRSSRLSGEETGVDNGPTASKKPKIVTKTKHGIRIAQKLKDDDVIDQILNPPAK